MWMMVDQKNLGEPPATTHTTPASKEQGEKEDGGSAGQKIYFDCQTWLDVEKNILMSPNHSNLANCSWLITSNFRSYITLDFKFIEVNLYSIKYR